MTVGWGVGQIRMGAAFSGWVASTSGGAASADFRATVRPTGTEVGDLLILMFHVGSANVTPLTFSGWTLLSGYDLQSQKFAIYSRIADLTATDTPTINPPFTWWGGWSMTAIRGYSTVTAVSHVKNPASLAMTGPVITTTVPNSLILSIGMTGNSTQVSAPTGGPVDRYRTNGGDHWALGVATEDKPVAGSGNAVTWAITPVPQHAVVYGLALAP